MNERPHTHYKAKDGVFLTRVGDEGMILNGNNEMCYQLNTTATKMWEQLAKGVSFKEVVQLIHVEYKIDQARVENDLGLLIDVLTSKGLLCESLESSNV